MGYAPIRLYPGKIIDVCGDPAKAIGGWVSYNVRYTDTPDMIAAGLRPAYRRVRRPADEYTPAPSILDTVWGVPKYLWFLATAAAIGFLVWRIFG